MPVYDTTEGKVVCKIIGKVLDENFARILVNVPNLSLSEIILLDKVQKREALTNDAIELLRKKGYIEGRKPNVYLSGKIVDATKHVGLKSTYVKNKSFDDAYFKKLIIDYIATYNKASRKEIEVLLFDKLSDIMSEKQKYNKVSNLLSALRSENKIKIISRKQWILNM